MSWATTLNDLASAWKVGIAFVILVALRYLLTTEVGLVEGLRTAVMGGMAELFGISPSARAEQAAEADTSIVMPMEGRLATPEGETFALDAEPVVAVADEMEPTRAPAEEMRHSVLEFIDSGLIALVLVFMIIRPFVVQAFYIPSASMQPTLQIDDKILVNKFIYRFRAPQRGDVIVFKAPPHADEEQKDFIKRLVAAPGDTVEVRDGVVYVNGKPTSENYIAEPPVYNMSPVKVEPNRVFVLGDNRNNSNDAHVWGWRPTDQLEVGRIRGRAMFIFWPIRRMGLVR